MNAEFSFRPRVFARLVVASLWSVVGCLTFVQPLAAQRLFRIGGWTGAAELAFSLQQQEADSLVGPSSLFDRDLSEERLTLRNTLTVVDRKFLIANYGFTLGLLQSRLTTDEDEGEGDGELRAFDLTATFRPLSPHRMTLLYSNYLNDTPVEFAGTRELRTSSLDFNMDVGPAWLPGNVRLRESQLVSTSEFGTVVRGLDQRRRGFTYTAANRWPRHELNTSYQFEDLVDRVAPRFSNRSQTANLSHRFEVLAPGLVTLRSILRYFDRSGELTSSSLYLDEELRLQHRKHLSTSFRFVNQELDSFSGPASDSQRGIVGLHHRLFDSLETNLHLGRIRSTSAGSRTDLDEAGLTSTYKKELPGKGKLTARLTSRYELRDSLRGNGQELVTEERHVLRFGVPARLERPGVIPESVIVTDELRATIFEEGVDYELLLITDFAEITPLPGGRISDAQAILVEYRVASPAMSKYSAVRNGFDLTLDYGWAAPFWGYRQVDNKLMEGAFDRLLDDQLDRFAGVRFRVSGRRVKFVSFNEFRTRDSEIQSFEALRLGESLTYRPRPRWTLRLNLVRLDTDFSVPVRETRISEGRLSLRWAPRPGLSFEAYMSARVSRDTASSDQTFERVGFHGRWMPGKITVLASVEGWQRDREEGQVIVEHFEGLTASLRISRRFFPGKLSTPRRRPPPEPWPVDLPGLWAEPGPQNQSEDEAEPAGEAEEAG